MERHFACTACGKCCYGILPLALDDALAHSHRFPLAVMWTPVRQGARAFALTSRLGVVIALPKRRKAAVSIVPVAYIPAALPCPELADDGLCRIHSEKPLRCRTMPFYPYRDESDQADLLTPRPGWVCDVSATAPVVYRDRVIVERDDFVQERAALERTAPILRTYAESLMENVPGVRDAVVGAALKPAGGYVIRSFAALLHRLPDHDPVELARRQQAILADFAARTAGRTDMAEYHRYYVAAGDEMARLVGNR